jgi:hypothetical protein
VSKIIMMARLVRFVFASPVLHSLQIPPYGPPEQCNAGIFAGRPHRMPTRIATRLCAIRIAKGAGFDVDFSELLARRGHNGCL